MILCFFMKNDIFSALIVQYYCRHGLVCLSESPAMFKLVVVPGTFHDTKTVSKEKKRNRRTIFLLPTTVAETKKKVNQLNGIRTEIVDGTKKHIYLGKLPSKETAW